MKNFHKRIIYGSLKSGLTGGIFKEVAVHSPTDRMLVSILFLSVKQLFAGMKV